MADAQQEVREQVPEEAPAVDGAESKEAAQSEFIAKARYWWAVLYVENMIRGWEGLIAELVQVPFAYCIHNLDVDSEGVVRKAHVHLILVFPNTTTYKHALAVFRQLGADACNTCKAVINIRYAYNYLIHDTATCRKQGKHLYDPEDRVSGNNFDIGSYEQLTTETKMAMLKELNDFIIDKRIEEMAGFWQKAGLLFDARYFQIAVSYNAVLDRTCKGVYIQEKRKREAAQRLSEHR